MGALSLLWMLVTHPDDLRTLIQFKMWFEPTRDITKPEEFVTSGYDRKTMRRCWEFLDLTSRSFSPVIKELEGDLARVVRVQGLYMPATRLILCSEDWFTLTKRSIRVGLS